MSKTILYSIAFIALGLGIGSLGPTLPALAAQTHVEMKQISNLFIARSFGTILGAWLIGRLYDRVSGHPLLAASLLISAIVLAMIPSASLLWMLFALSILLGLASASINVGGNMLIALVHGDGVRPFLSTMHFAFGLGGLLAPILVGLFVHRSDSLQITYRTLAFLTLPAALLILLSRSPVLQRLKGEDRPRPLPASMLGLFVLFFFLEVGAEASIIGWYFSYATEHRMESRTAAQMNSAFWAAFTVGRLATIRLAMQFKEISIIMTNLCLTIILVASTLYLSSSPFVLWMGAIGLGLFVAPIFPNTFSYAQRRLGLSGRVTGWFLAGSSAGGMFWPWLIGQFFKSNGPRVLMWIVLLNLCGALATTAIMFRRSSRLSDHCCNC
ncbi:MAG: MFS transporter [Acidobacteria bacterium]|nr:MFS transporter [Acidobacteriota bacterium]